MAHTSPPAPSLRSSTATSIWRQKGERFGTETRSHSCLRAGSCDGGDRPIDHDVGGPLPESREQFGSADPAEADDLPGSKLLKGQAPPALVGRKSLFAERLILFSCGSPLHLHLVTDWRSRFCDHFLAHQPPPAAPAPKKSRSAFLFCAAMKRGRTPIGCAPVSDVPPSIMPPGGCRKHLGSA